MGTRIEEIGPEIYRISSYIGKIDLQFNQFLIRDAESVLYHTGMRGLFSEVRTAVAQLIDPASLRWIGFSHFEADECGSLNEWLALAPRAEVFTGAVGALVNINDFIGGKARTMAHREPLETGRFRFRFLETPQVPHGWDASLLFEETGGTLFCSDLLLQNGDLPGTTEADVVGPARQALLNYQAGPLAHPFPFTPLTAGTLRMLSDLDPKLIAAMHGSSFRGDGAAAVQGLATMLAETIGPQRQ